MLAYCDTVPFHSLSQIKVMSAKVDSEVQAFTLELEKFGSRWNQLKPRDDIATSSDKEATAQALASLKERRAEFNELVSTATKLRFGWTAIGQWIPSGFCKGS